MKSLSNCGGWWWGGAVGSGSRNLSQGERRMYRVNAEQILEAKARGWSSHPNHGSESTMDDLQGSQSPDLNITEHG